MGNGLNIAVSTLQPLKGFKKRILTPQERMRQVAYGGRAIGKPAGSHMAELCALRKGIWLCWKCSPKFDHKHHHYYLDRRFPYVQGDCDGCRDFTPQAKFYIHESLLAGPRGTAHHGSSWIPR